MSETHRHLGGHRDDAVGKEAMRHGSVQERGDDAAVQNALIPLEAGVAGELRLDTAVGAEREAQAETIPVVPAADDAPWMCAAPCTFQQVFGGPVTAASGRVCLRGSRGKPQSRGT